MHTVQEDRVQTRAPDIGVRPQDTHKDLSDNCSNRIQNAGTVKWTMQVLSLRGKTKVPVAGRGVAGYDLVREDCFLWMKDQSEATVEAIVTDPPFGLVEYSEEQLMKRQAGKVGLENPS